MLYDRTHFVWIEYDDPRQRGIMEYSGCWSGFEIESQLISDGICENPRVFVTEDYKSACKKCYGKWEY